MNKEQTLQEKLQTLREELKKNFSYYEKAKEVYSEYEVLKCVYSDYKELRSR